LVLHLFSKQFYLVYSLGQEETPFVPNEF